MLATVALWGVLLGVWSVVAPLGEAPDEPAHLGLVLHLADGHPYPDYDGLQNPRSIIRLCKAFTAATRACPKPGEVVTPTSTRLHPVGEAPDKASRPAWNDLGDDVRVGQLNQMPQHPPLYYQAMALVLRVERAVLGHPMSLDRELALLRLVNALLVLPVPLLAWWAAVRLGAVRPVPEVAGLAVLALPQLAHIGSTLNNDNLLTLIGAALLAVLAGVLAGDRSLRTAAGVGALAALGLLVKAFALAFLPAIALAYLLARPRRDGLRPLGLAALVTVVGAGWWYIGVRLRTGTFTPSVEDQRLTTALRSPGFSPHAGTFARTFVGELTERTWGSFGWYTVRVPGWLTVACTLLALVAIGLGLVTGVPRRGRRPLAVLLVPTLVLALLVVQRAWTFYVRTSLFKFIQGRYLFAGLVGVVLVAAVGLVRVGGRWALPGLAGAVVLLQAEGLRLALEGWWGGPGLGPRGQARALVAWSAWPGELLAVGAAVGLAVGVWFVVELVRATIAAGPGEGSRKVGPVVSGTP